MLPFTCLDEVPATAVNCAIRVSCSEMSAIVETAEGDDERKTAEKGAERGLCFENRARQIAQN